MDKLQSALGIIVFISICILISENKKSVNFKLIFGAVFLQFIFALIFLKFPAATLILGKLDGLVTVIDEATKFGSQFVLGYLAGGMTPFEITNPASNFIIATQILPIILTISAVVAVLYHYGIIQRIVFIVSKLLQKTLKIDGPTALGVASSIFLGIIESPIFVKPYLKEMNRSSFFTLITASMATVAGTVLVLYATVLKGTMENPIIHLLTASFMSAPAAVMFAKILIPSEEVSFNESLRLEDFLEEKTDSVFEAIINATSEAMTMIINIIGVLIVIFSLVALVNIGIGSIPGLSETRLENLAGYIFIPFVWLMGIPWEETFQAGQLMAMKTIMNEFVAYSQLGSFQLSEKTNLVLVYALCGFANFGSLGILVGGLIPIVPEKKRDILSLGTKSMLAGTMATMTTGAIINILN